MQVRTVAQAVVAPILRGYLVHEAGVFDAGGQFVHEAVLWRGRPLLVPAPMPQIEEHLPGRWIWGGVLIGHFGHFLTESTGRLWALDAIRGAVDGLVFIARQDVQPGEISGFHKQFFDLLCPDLPVRVIFRATSIDVLEVPGQGFGIGPLTGGTKNFRDLMHQRFASGIAANGAERLYISRSGLDAAMGSVLAEPRLECCLADCGYDIFHPQNHSLPEQIARYKAARRIVALDGSALHLVAMVARADQKIAMIKRRISNGSNGIIRHLTAFSGREPLVLDAIMRQWVRSDRRGADNFSFAELDFEMLAAGLAAHGFVPGGAFWPSLTAQEAAAAVHQIETLLKSRRLSFAPTPRGVPASAAPAPHAPAPVEDREAKRARRAARRAKRLQATAAAN